MKYLYENYRENLQLRVQNKSIKVEIDDEFWERLDNFVVNGEDRAGRDLWRCVSELSKIYYPELGSVYVNLGNVIKNDSNLEFHMPNIENIRTINFKNTIIPFIFYRKQI